MSEEEIVGKKVISGVAWTYAEKLLAQGVSFVVSIVLARLLLPEAFGLIAIVNAFVGFLTVFVDSGFAYVLVQKKNADDLDFDTIFIFSSCVGILLYIILFLCSDYIANYYQQPELVNVIRVLALRLPISGINTVQVAYIQRRMQYKLFFFATLGGTVASAFVGLGMAYCGCGVWALVAQNLSNLTIDTSVLTVISKWKPKLRFSFDRMKHMAPFGARVLLTNLINTGSTEGKSLIVGKFYSSSSLAYYDRGKRFPYIIISNLNSSLYKVLFPTFSRIQDDKKHIADMLIMYYKVASYIVMPCILGMAAVAPQMVEVLLTNKWIAIVPFIRIICFSLIFRVYETASHSALSAINKNNTVLRIMEIITGVSLAATFFISKGGLDLIFVAWVEIGSAFICLVMTLYYIKRYFEIGYKKQLFSMMPPLILSTVMSITVALLGLINISAIMLLIIQMFVGAIIYYIGSRIFKIEGYLYCVKLIKRLIIHRKNKNQEDNNI